MALHFLNPFRVLLLLPILLPFSFYECCCLNSLLLSLDLFCLFAVILYSLNSYNVLVTVLGRVDFGALSKTDSAVLDLKA